MKDWATWLRWGIPIVLGLAIQSGTFYLNSVRDEASMDEKIQQELLYLGRYIQDKDMQIQHRMDRFDERIDTILSGR